MKTPFHFGFIALILCFFGVGGSALARGNDLAQSKNSAQVREVTRPPTSANLSAEELRARLLSTLLRQSSRKLPGKNGCEAQAGRILGDWVATNLSYFEADQANSIRASCEILPGAIQRCSVEFNADSKGESPWSCGFRFRIDRDLKKIDFKTLECIGTC